MIVIFKQNEDEESQETDELMIVMSLHLHKI